MSGLELAGHFDPPARNFTAKEEDKYPYHLPDGLQVSYAQKPPSPFAWHECRLRPTTLILSIALASVTLLAIIAAAVGGSLATKKAHVTEAPTHPSPSTIPQNVNSSSCPIANVSTASPADDCATLSPTYVSGLSSNATFNISCDTAFHDHNILGVFVHRFEDCMEACASFNHFQSSGNFTCYGVTFDLRRPQQGGKGNCFLKDLHGINSTAMLGVSSAEWILG